MSVYSGSKYLGDEKSGWFHGEGEFTYPSGVKYKGQFFKGQFHGEGTLIYQNGVGSKIYCRVISKVDGIWEN